MGAGGGPNGTFYTAGGTLRRDAECYVTRQADNNLCQGLLAGDLCYVLTARQMGKSSLMVRTADRLRGAGVAVSVLDLTAFGQNLTAEQWYEALLLRVGEQLGLEDEVEDHWLRNGSLAPLQRLTGALTEIVLPAVLGPVVIFVDEIDIVRSLPFPTDELFAAIRELHNRRATQPELSRLAFCLLGVATPSDLIQDVRTTPFNIGQRVELGDFTAEEARVLASGLPADPETANRVLNRVLFWTDGHPYLTQRLCQAAVAAGAYTFDAVDRVCRDLFLSPVAGEQDPNLAFVGEGLRRSIAGRPELLELYWDILHGHRVDDDPLDDLVEELHLSGLVRAIGGRLYPRNRVYRHVFDGTWINQQLAAGDGPEPSPDGPDRAATDTGGSPPGRPLWRVVLSLAAAPFLWWWAGGLLSVEGNFLFLIAKAGQAGIRADPLILAVLWGKAPYSAALALSVACACATVTAVRRFESRPELRRSVRAGLPGWRLLLPLVALAAGSCLASFAVFGWVAPMANRASSEALWRLFLEHSDVSSQAPYAESQRPRLPDDMPLQILMQASSAENDPTLRRRLGSELGARSALTLGSLCMVLLAAPLAYRFGRWRTGPAVAVASGVVLSYYAALSWGRVWALHGSTTPWFGAALPILLALVLGPMSWVLAFGLRPRCAKLRDPRRPCPRETPATSPYRMGGALAFDDPSYVVREADRSLHDTLARGEPCYVLTPRQTGKSSLVARTAARLRSEGFTVACIDLTAMGQILSPEQWYAGLRAALGEQVGLERSLCEPAATGTATPLQMWVSFLTEVVLPRAPKGLVVFVDEVDAVRVLPFAADGFFSSVRELYNRRSSEPRLCRLTFCLLGVASPDEIISQRYSTPLNVGQRIELQDLAEDQCGPLERGLGGGASAHRLMRRILFWTAGHPYLTQKLCAAVTADARRSGAHPSVVDKTCVAMFLSSRGRERDPDLAHTGARLLSAGTNPAGALETYWDILAGRRVVASDSREVANDLVLAGLCREVGGALVPRNRIYRRVFDGAWVNEQLERAHGSPAGRRGTSRDIPLGAPQRASSAGRQRRPEALGGAKAPWRATKIAFRYTAPVALVGAVATWLALWFLWVRPASATLGSRDELVSSGLLGSSVLLAMQLGWSIAVTVGAARAHTDPVVRRLACTDGVTAVAVLPFVALAVPVTLLAAGPAVVGLPMTVEGSGWVGVQWQANTSAASYLWFTTFAGAAAGLILVGGPRVALAASCCAWGAFQVLSICTEVLAWLNTGVPTGAVWLGNVLLAAVAVAAVVLHNRNVRRFARVQARQP